VPKDTSGLRIPTVPISWGELFDKFTILELKLKRVASRDALDNVKKEYVALADIVIRALSENSDVAIHVQELRDVNKTLWDIEDSIRAKEAEKNFDDEFIQIARSVYLTNDERAKIKRLINDRMNSSFKEEKCYKG
jgi:hypothetical protein